MLSLNQSNIRPTNRASPVVVFLGKFSQGSTDNGIRQGLIELGWIVHSIERTAFEIHANHWTLKSLRRVLGEVNKAGLQEVIINTCRDLKPDFFLTVKGVLLDVDTIRELQAIGVPCVCYYPDFHFDYPGLQKETIFSYDFFFTTKIFQLQFLQEGGYNHRAFYLPHGYCPDTHRPFWKLDNFHNEQFDIQYIGNSTNYKAERLIPSFTNASQLSKRIFGHGWVRYQSSVSDHQFHLGDAVNGISYAKAIQEARINIGLHMGPAENGWQDTTSTRTFEIPACGGFMLHVDNSEVRELFAVGSEIDVFSSKEEMLDKSKFYLKKPSLRRSMLVAAHARAVSHHSYSDRAKKMCHCLLANT